MDKQCIDEVITPYDLPVKRGSEMSLVLSQTYENLFESVIDRVMNGEPLAQILREDPRQISISEYRRWVNGSKERKERYAEAKRLGAEAVEDELIAIADGDGDVNRDQLRINTRKFLLGVWDKSRYTKDGGGVSTGSGGVVINIGQVESPYKVIEGEVGE